MNGKSVFKGLVTATNELGEIRLQFHIVTDGHDQMVNALREFRNTVHQYGQQMPELLFTDKPSDDYAFFREQLPSLIQKEDALSKFSRCVNFPTGIPSCEIDLDDVQFVETVNDIDTVVNFLIQHLREKPVSRRVIRLDEEHEYGSKSQFPPNGRDRIALLQLAYEYQTGDIRAILIKCHHLTRLPRSLVELFRDPEIL